MAWAESKTHFRPVGVLAKFQKAEFPQIFLNSLVNSEVLDAHLFQGLQTRYEAGYMGGVYKPKVLFWSVLSIVKNRQLSCFLWIALGIFCASLRIGSTGFKGYGGESWKKKILKKSDLHKRRPLQDHLLRADGHESFVERTLPVIRQKKRFCSLCDPSIEKITLSFCFPSFRLFPGHFADLESQTKILFSTTITEVRYK